MDIRHEVTLSQVEPLLESSSFQLADQNEHDIGKFFLNIIRFIVHIFD